MRWLILCLFPTIATAGGDTLVQQGRLLDGVGTPLHGPHSVAFTIYDSSGDVWSETDTVDFADGYYATVLGDGPTPLSNLDFANTDYSLGIAIDGGPELTPHTPFASVVRSLTGPVNISDLGVQSPCTSAAEGTIRYHSGAVEVCNGSQWATVGTGTPPSECSAGTQTFTFNGLNSTFTMPSGCSSLTVQAWGAGGAGGYSSGGRTHHGGAGGYTSATLSTSPGTSYVVLVGEGGERNTGPGNSNVAVGFAGAPYGSSSPCAVGGGGGLSGLFINSVGRGNAVVIAGGGGGSSGYTYGGPGNDAVHGGGESSMTGESGNSAWEGGGGGGYNGGSLHIRDTNSTSYYGGEGGTGFAGHPSVLPGSVVMLSAGFQDRTPPGTGFVGYLGTGSSGDNAIAYGGLGGAYGENCDTSGNGLVVLTWEE